MNKNLDLCLYFECDSLERQFKKAVSRHSSHTSSTVMNDSNIGMQGLLESILMINIDLTFLSTEWCIHR